MTNRMNRLLTGVILAAAMFCLMASGCGAEKQEEPDGGSPAGAYRQISQEEAMRMMREEKGYIILDVRREDEYAAGHIPGAVLIPNESIEDVPPALLPDMDQLILIYCRSGNRSKQAAQKLAEMGYTSICEFGGINTWPGEIVTGE